MSKTTPEEAARLAKKHGATRHEGGGYTNLTLTSSQLAALIDEVRGVDAEPVAYQYRVHFADHQDPGWSRWQECNREEFLRLSHRENNEVLALCTHPAPSQPAGKFGDNQITEIVGWPAEPEMVKYRKVAEAAAIAALGSYATCKRCTTPEKCSGARHCGYEPAAPVELPKLPEPDTTHYAQWAGDRIKFHSVDQIIEFANARVAAAIAAGRKAS